LSQFHNSAAFITDMNASQHSGSCADRLLASDRYLSYKLSSRDLVEMSGDKANLDEGHTWPTAFALKEMTPAEKAKIGALVNKAVS
jgi:hypothetical protein